MHITSVKVNLREENTLKGFASICFDDCFVVHGLRIVEIKNRMLIAMPSKKKTLAGSDEWVYKDIAHPISSEFRQEMEKVVLAEYFRVYQEFQNDR